MANPNERWTGRGAYKGEESCRILVEACEKGASVEGVCKLLGVSEATYYKWRDKYPEFAEAIAYGRTLSKAWGKDMLLEFGMSDRKCNQAVLIFAAKNRWEMHDEIKLSETDDRRQALLDTLAEKSKAIVDRS